MYVAEPHVQLLAHTTIVPDTIEQRMEIQEGSTDADAEFQRVARMIRDQLHDLAPGIIKKENH